MSSPDYGQLFSLSDPVANKPFRGDFVPGEIALGLSRGDLRCDKPVHINWAMGAALPADIIWTTSGCPLIVHARVIDLFEMHGLTGWTGYPVQVRAKNGTRLPDYIGLSITGRCGPIDLTRSEIVLRQFPRGWIPYFQGHFFAHDTWDGSDLFMESADALGKVTARRFVGPRTHKLLRQINAPNLKFGRLSEHSLACSIFEIGLRHLLPPDYADRVAFAYERSKVPRPPFV